MASFWNKQEELKVMPKNKKEDIRVFLCERQGKEYVQIQIYTTTNTSEEKIPTQKTVVIPRESFEKDIKEVLDRLITKEV
jgi:hypothetical protein